jgi:hypothetical protein
MTLDERRRGMGYWLAAVFGLSPNPEDAIHLERVMGLARGRSGNAHGLVPWAPDPVFPSTTPLTATALREAVLVATPDTFEAARAAIHSLLHLLRFLYPVLISADRGLRRFADEANKLFDEAPADAFALMTAIFISSIHRQDLPPDEVRRHTEALQAGQIYRELRPHLTAAERDELLAQMRRHTA